MPARTVFHQVDDVSELANDSSWEASASPANITMTGTGAVKRLPPP